MALMRAGAAVRAIKNERNMFFMMNVFNIPVLRFKKHGAFIDQRGPLQTPTSRDGILCPFSGWRPGENLEKNLRFFLG
jgi:hypothetical protein